MSGNEINFEFEHQTVPLIGALCLALRVSNRVRAQITLLLALATLLTGCGTPSVKNHDNGAVSISSIMPDLRASAEKETTGLIAPYLLALETKVDGRPWRVERALLVFRSAGERWWLITAGRAPLAPGQAWLREWHVYEVIDAWYGAEEFDHKPTKEEVRRFLSNTWWDQPPSEGWRREKAEVYSEEWESALGFGPIIKFTRNGANLFS